MTDYGNLFLEAGSDALMAVSPEGRILYWNQGAERTFGYLAQEAVGRQRDDLIPDLQPEPDLPARESLRRRKDGGLVYVNVSSQPVLSEDGRLQCTLCNERDVTRLKSERDARMLESRFRDLLESIPDAIVIINRSGRIVLVNGESERLFGYPRSELLTQPVEMLLPERFRGGHLAHRSLYFAQPRTRSMGAGLELFGLRRGGAEFPVEISLSPLQTDEGTLTVSAIRDVSASKRAEQKFRALLEATPDAMVIVDSEGKIVLVNGQTEKLFGYRRIDLLGQSVDLLVPERFRGQHAGHRQGFYRHPRTREMGAGLQLFGLRQDASEFPLEISLSPLETEEGLLVLSAIRDVTERKRVEERLQHASQMKSEFLAHMSHELRTPLNAIIGFSQVLLEEIAGPLAAPQREYLGDVLNAAQHLLGLINDVLDLSRVEAGKMPLSPSRFSLADAVGEVCVGLQSLAHKKRIELVSDVSSDLPSVYLDRQRLRQVMSNLLSNALKFTNEGGRVAIMAELDQTGHILLQVQDSGIGIAAEDLPRLFMDFEQLDSGSTQSFQGSGLGLSLTRKIVEVQGGSIEVESQPGVGSLFTVRLPQTP